MFGGSQAQITSDIANACAQLASSIGQKITMQLPNVSSVKSTPKS